MVLIISIKITGAGTGAAGPAKVFTQWLCVFKLNL